MKEIIKLNKKELLKFISDSIKYDVGQKVIVKRRGIEIGTVEKIDIHTTDLGIPATIFYDIQIIDKDMFITRVQLHEIIKHTDETEKIIKDYVNLFGNK